jgi:outer membrane protein TolC
MTRTLFIASFLALPCAASAQNRAVLTFDKAAEMLLRDNPRAAAAARSMDAARDRVSYYKGGLFPRVSANADYSRLGTEPLPSRESYSYGFSASQPLFSPALPAAVRSARASYSGTEAEYDRIRSSLLLELKTVFADLLKAGETLKLSGETLKRRAENEEMIRIKYEAGRENKAALLETRAANTTAKWQHENYKKDLRLLERKLDGLLGRPPAERPGAGPLPEPPAPPETMDGLSGELERHPSLRAARAEEATAAASVDRSVSGMLPDASANGRYSWAGSDWPDKTKNWSAGVSLSLPLFNGGKLPADLAASKADKARAEASLKNIREEVSLNAENAFLSWRQAWLYIDVSKSSLEAANARAWLVRRQYIAGQTSYFEWRNVEDQLVAAENQALAARRDLAVAYAAFLNALGE